jgi:hypothetical protein
MFKAIWKKKEKVLYKVRIIIYKCKRLRKEVLLKGNILLNNYNIAALLKVIINLK